MLYGVITEVQRDSRLAGAGFAQLVTGTVGAGAADTGFGGREGFGGLESVPGRLPQGAVPKAHP